MPNPNHIPEPLNHDPDALVENVYPEPGTLDVQDLESQDRMSEYLEERIRPDPGPQYRVYYTQSGKSWPRIEREQVGTKVTNYYEHDGWVWPFTQKWAAGVIVGSFILANTLPTIEDTYDEARQLGHEIYRVFDPVDDQQIPVDRLVPQVEPAHHITVDTNASNLPGSAAIDQLALGKFERQAARVKRQGGKIVSVEITGRSSDEYGSNDSIGTKEPAYKDFADERADSYTQAVASADVFKGVPIITTIDQNVLTPQQKNKVEQAAEVAGFDGPNNIIDAINSVAAGEQPDSKLQRLVNRLFVGKRGVTLDATVNIPREIHLVKKPGTESVPGVDTPPENPDRDYHFIFMPWLIVPRFRKVVDGIKPVRRWRMVPGAKRYTPHILREQEDQAWLRIRPEAVNDDGSLVPQAWSFTRKYEHLLRDRRIKDVVRADFPGKDGEKKSLRVMFIDNSPAEETITAFEELLKKFSSMQDGKLADRVSGIFVFPSESTGTNHGDPKQIALGVDKQSGSGLLGTYTPILDMVELHMPTTWDADEVEEIFSSFYGPGWTTAHEVAGHGTDDSDSQLQLRRVWTRGIQNAYVIQGDHRARRMQSVHTTLRHLPQSLAAKIRRAEFDISYRVIDNQGNIVTTTARVRENDQSLAHASHATIVGQQPTGYAAKNVGEHYAETAAAVTTGIEIPFNEAQVTVASRTTDDGQPADFANGYRPDQRAQDVFTAAVGAQKGVFPVAFADPAKVVVSHVAPANDPMIRQHLLRTSRLQTLLPNEMVAILARVTQRNRQAGAK